MGLAALAVSGRDRTPERGAAGEDQRFDVTPGLRDLVLGCNEAEAQARLAFWQSATGGQATGEAALERQLAMDILAQRGVTDPAKLLALRQPMLATAASALRAAGQTRANGPSDALAEMQSVETPFRGFFAVKVAGLRHRRFDGSMSAALRREAFVSTDAVTVLPYDPAADRVLLVEQFRMGPFIRGEARPWLIEAIAGRVDAGETAEEAARREAQEEAGISLGSLYPVADYYPSPGAMTEYIWSFLGLTDLSQSQGGHFGLVAEGEDIRSHVISFTQAMAWLAEGRLANAPLILSLLWLARERSVLRRGAGIAG